MQPPAHPVGCTLFRNHKQSIGYSYPETEEVGERKFGLMFRGSRLSSLRFVIPQKLDCLLPLNFRVCSIDESSTIYSRKPVIADDAPWKQLQLSRSLSLKKWQERDGRLKRTTFKFSERSDNPPNVGNMVIAMNVIIIELIVAERERERERKHESTSSLMRIRWINFLFLGNCVYRVAN